MGGKEDRLEDVHHFLAHGVLGYIEVRFRKVHEGRVVFHLLHLHQLVALRQGRHQGLFEVGVVAFDPPEGSCYFLDCGADVLLVASELLIFQLLVDAYIIRFLLRLFEFCGVGLGFLDVSLDFGELFAA